MKKNAMQASLHSLNRAGFLRAITVLFLFLAASGARAEIVTIPSGPPRAQPEIRFERLPGEEAVRMVVVAPADMDGLFLPEVSIESQPQGAAGMQPAGPLNYRLEAGAGSAVKVKVTGSPDGEVIEAYAFIGDFAGAARALRQRFARLPGDSAETTGLAARLRDEMVAWLQFWLEDLGPEPKAGGGEGFRSGESVRWLWQASQYLDWLEGGKDLVALARGRQLPARHVFTARVGSEAREIAFNYLVRLPEGTGESGWPFLGIVHGFTPTPTLDSARRDEMEAVAAKSDFPFLTAALAFNGDMRQKGGWNPGEVTAFMDSLADYFRVDRERIYLSGFSMGGYGTYNAVSLRPDLFAACAILCGFADPAWAQSLASVPTYLYHGDQDDAVSCFRSLKTYEALRAAGGHPQFFIYEGMGHPVWSAVYREPGFYQRLLAHTRLPLASRESRTPGIPGTGASSIEFTELPALDLPKVLWLNHPGLRLGSFLDNPESSESVSMKTVELLYPKVPMCGNILIVLPEGMSGPDSPILLGVPVRDSGAWPELGFTSPLRSSGPSAVYRGRLEVDQLAPMARLFDAMGSARTDFANDSILLLEVESFGLHQGSRINFRWINSVPQK